MVKSVVDELVSDKHMSYDEFYLWQYIADLDIGDKVKIEIDPADGSGKIDKEFEATNINCHINCQWQDKGEKKVIE
jgi:ribosomal protein L21E